MSPDFLATLAIVGLLSTYNIFELARSAAWPERHVPPTRWDTLFLPSTAIHAFIIVSVIGFSILFLVLAYNAPTNNNAAIVLEVISLLGNSYASAVLFASARSFAGFADRRLYYRRFTRTRWLELHDIQRVFYIRGCVSLRMTSKSHSLPLYLSNRVELLATLRQFAMVNNILKERGAQKVSG